MIANCHYQIFWISYLSQRKLSDDVREKTVGIEGVFWNDQEEIITSLQNSYIYFRFSTRKCSHDVMLKGHYGTPVLR